MALKPPFSSLYCYPGLSGFEAFPRRRSLHGLSYPWVSGSNTLIALLLRHFTMATPALGDVLSWRRFLLATLALGVASSRRRLMLTLTSTLTLTLTLSTPGYGTVQFQKVIKVSQLLSLHAHRFLSIWKETLSSLFNLRQIQIACIQYKVLKHNVLSPHRHVAIGGTSMTFLVLLAVSERRREDIE